MSGLLTDLVGSFMERRAAAPIAPSSIFPQFIEEILTSLWGIDGDTSTVRQERLTAVWACVKCISEDAAKIPIKVVRRVGDNVYEPVEGHPLNYLLNVSPDDEISAFDFRAALLRWAVLHGNGIAFPNFGGNGYIRRLTLSAWSQVTMRRDETGALVYDHTGATKSTRGIPAIKVVHIKGPTDDGLVGISTIQAARRAWAMADAAQEFGSTFFKASARPSGVLSFKGKPTEQVRKEIRESFQQQNAGSNIGRTALVWDEATYQPLTMPLEDAQFVETMQATKPEICAWFRVPPHKVQDLSRATYNNIEQAELGYVRDALMPWFVRIEQELARKCLERGLELMHEDDELLRGDFKSTQEAYALQRQWGLRTINEIRRRDGLPPVEGGDRIFVPANQITIEAATTQTQGQGQAQPAQDGQAANLADPAAAGSGRGMLLGEKLVLAAVAARRMLEGQADRLLNIEEDRTAKASRASDPVKALAEFRASHRDYVRARFGDVTEIVAEMVGGPLAGKAKDLAATLTDAWTAMPAPTADSRARTIEARAAALTDALIAAAGVLIREGAPHADRSAAGGGRSTGQAA